MRDAANVTRVALGQVSLQENLGQVTSNRWTQRNTEGSAARNEVRAGTNRESNFGVLSSVPKTTVLVVEDDSALRALYWTSLTAAGYRVAAFEDGLDALHSR